jgi:hypothetical protein
VLFCWKGDREQRHVFFAIFWQQRKYPCFPQIKDDFIFQTQYFQVADKLAVGPEGALG